MNFINKWKFSKIDWKKLSEYAWVNPKTDVSFLKPEDEVTFIPMEAVDENTGTVHLQKRFYKEVSKGYTIFAEGDVIWAKITPCMQNGKSAVIKGLLRGVGFGSTEFHVIRPKEHIILPEFLWAILSLPSLKNAAQGTFSGSAGQQRVPAEFIKNLPIPSLSISDQQKITKNLLQIREESNKKIKQANDLLNGINQFVLNQMNLSLPKKENILSWCIKLKDLKNNRCDTDYHSPGYNELRQIIEHGKYSAESIQNLCFKISSGFAAGRKEQTDCEINGIPHIRPLNITIDGQLTLEGTKYIPKNVLIEGEKLTENEVLFNNTNSKEVIGKTTVFKGGFECVCSNHITRLFVDQSRIIPEYLAIILNVMRGLGIFGLLATKFNNQAGINSLTLGNFRIPVPPLELQKKIVTNVLVRYQEAENIQKEAIISWFNELDEFENQLLTWGGNKNE